jgi:hypothetical protein
LGEDADHSRRRDHTLRQVRLDLSVGLSRCDVPLGEGGVMFETETGNALALDPAHLTR